MHLRTRTWVLLSLLCFVGAAIFWKMGNDRMARRQQDASESVPAPDKGSNQAQSIPLAPAQNLAPAAAPSALSPLAPPHPLLRLRLSNTTQPLEQLMRNDSALLLRNALLDTRLPASLPIPAHLRGGPDPGSYVVQSRGPLTDDFRAQLKAAGASIVSYIPNNAYLVRASTDGAAQLAALAQTQSVQPWEPYFKLEWTLLDLAVAQTPLPEGTVLNVLLFPGEKLPELGLDVLAEDRSPFGLVITVRPKADSLVTLAQSPAVQGIERHLRRVPANDLSRVRVGISTNTTEAAPNNYLGLTGDGVLVNVNDTGGDKNHPDLIGRLFGDAPSTLVDLDGHGTHVIGTILGNGSQSSTVASAPPGSTNMADFRGMAPNARAFVMPINLIVGPIQTETYLQENAARTNAFISNNSWGYPSANDYNFASASFDEAVRDALPQTPGSQPVLYVFAAGNSGFGGNDGLSGIPGSVSAPATAKNVITVGALENRRNITNLIVTSTETNAPFKGLTDSSTQVAAFSSRGNVGIGVEGPFGRFKPDVVAPGTFLISTRSADWENPTVQTAASANTIPGQLVLTGQTNMYSIDLPLNATFLGIRVLPNNRSPQPFPAMPIFAREGQAPPPSDFSDTVGNQLFFPVTGGTTWFYAVGNTTPQDVNYDVQSVIIGTNAAGGQQAVLNGLNDALAPYYRYESGTSMSAPVVSGLLALMQEFFQTKFNTRPSPALMKALLINGSRTVNALYDFSPFSGINYQGWGLPNITNVLSRVVNDNPLTEATWPVRFFEQSPTNALITGQSQTHRLALVTTNALRSSLRVTLVWTDPPGNPAASLKLVNDLDLIVTNLDNGQIYYGNNITPGSVFNSASDVTNAPLTDLVNNVENVFLPGLTGTNFAITVFGRRVNVNAVTAHPDGVAQDYALVISSANSGLSTPFLLLDPPMDFDPSPRVRVVTNGTPLFNERVGANSPMFNVTTNGVTNQWNFYVFVNSGLTNTNVAFATFLPPNLSRPRFFDADLDLYVSLDPSLTNLNATAIGNAFKSVNRGGAESVIFQGAAPNTTYYVGVKSEDQQSATYGFFAFAGPAPFNDTDTNGNVFITGVPAPIDIPDGTPDEPQAALVFAFAPPLKPLPVQNVVVTNTLTHELGGDLLGQLSHGQNSVVLNNHRNFVGTQTFVYDDSDSGDILISEPSNGPGSLRNFVGEDGQGYWLLTMVDSAFFHTGRVDNLLIKIEPRLDALLDPGVGIVRTILPNRFFFTFVDVPADATNLTVFVSGNNGPMEIFIRRGDFPSLTVFDKRATVPPGGGSLSLGRADAPPLSAGQYFIGIYNPNANPETVNIKVRIDRDLRPALLVNYASNHRTPLLDDAVTNSLITVNNRQQIVDVNVGIRIAHPRESDLSIHLVSPRGTRLLLTENRGRLDGNGYGGGTLTTNAFSADAQDNTPATFTNVLNTADTSGTLQVSYDFQLVPDQMQVFYDGALIFDTGLVNGVNSFTVDYGPGNSTNVVIVMNPGGNPNPTTSWSYTATIVTGQFNYAVFTDNTNLTRVPIKFADPPFTTNALTARLNKTNFISGFEATAAAAYAQASTVDGWRVVSNEVAVINDRSLTFTNAQYPPPNNNFLALANATIARTLPTAQGKQYLLTFNYRDPGTVSWWPALLDINGQVVDIVDSNPGLLVTGAQVTPAGYIGPAFLFASASQHVNINDSVNLTITNSITVEAWINAAGNTFTGRGHVFIRGDNRTDLNPYNLSLEAAGTGLPTVNNPNRSLRWRIDGGAPNGSQFVTLYSGTIPTNTWIHAVGTLEGATGLMRLYSNGVIVAQTIAPYRPFATLANNFQQPGIGIGNHHGTTINNGFPGRIDEVTVYNRALSPTEIKAIYNAQTAGKYTALSNLPNASITVGGTSNVLVGTNFWQQASLTFGAISNGTPFSVSGHPLGMLFDNFQLVELANDAYYLPEESLALLRGESALGDWKLEIWDNRVGAFITDTELLSWKLSFTFANTNPPVTFLTNGLPVNGSVCGRDIAYFVVEVPLSATFATNTLTSPGDMQLLYDASGLPTGDPLIDDIILNAIGAGGSEVLLLRSTLQTFNPRYLNSGQTYYLGVQNAPGVTNCNTFTIRVDFNSALPLPLNAPFLSNGVETNAMIAATNLLTYYAFAVPTNAVGVKFELYNLSGDVNLVARRGLPLPNPTSFDYSSVSPGITPEVIDLFDYTFQLLPGIWYLGVYNLDPAPVTYSIKATITLSGQLPVELTNSVSITNTIGTNVIAFYQYEVSSNAYRVDFEVLNLSGNADLYVQQFLPGGPAMFDYSSTSPGTSSEIVTVDTNSVPVPISEGTWFMSVVNVDTNSVSYVVRITEYTNAPPVFLNNGVAFTNIIPGTVAGSVTSVTYYVFVINSNSIRADFLIRNASGNVDLFIKNSLPLPSPTSFDYAGTNPGTNDEQIIVRTSSVPVPLSPGLWSAAVLNLETNAVTYTIKVSQYTTTNADQIVIQSISSTPNSVTLDWTAETWMEFGVQWTPGPLPTNGWNTFPPVVTSTTTNFFFFDNGARPGGPGPGRIYRLQLKP